MATGAEKLLVLGTGFDVKSCETLAGERHTQALPPTSLSPRVCLAGPWARVLYLVF